VARAGTDLRIGVNALYLIPGEVGGTQIYLTSLLSALASVDPRNEYFVFGSREMDSGIVPESPRFRLIRTGVKARNRPARIVYEQIVLPVLLLRHGISVVLNPGFTAPVMFPGASVTVFHDLQHKRHPEFFRWFDLPFWNLLLWASARRSRSLIAVSQATASDLSHYYPFLRGRIHVIPHGVEREFFRIGDRRHAGSEEPYLLTVSTLHPHKNLSRLLEAFLEFRKARPEFRLVIAGLRGHAADSLERRRRELGLENSVTFTGWIPRADLFQLFEHADAFIAPSLFEGFGMPILEALAAGIPSACSSIAPFDAIAGDAALRFSPDSAPAMTAAMLRVTGDPDLRTRSRIEGPKQARRFDWDQCARLTLAVLEKAAP
jgi:glycosyltransferase involved in cell wall biosynthesis